jgi:hypothetical protein
MMTGYTVLIEAVLTTAVGVLPLSDGLDVHSVRIMARKITSAEARRIISKTPNQI